MPEFTKPNLKIPTSLWGEVKVSAFRRGVKPVEVVIECLKDRFGGGLRAGGTDGDAQRGGSIPRSKTVKATLDVASESKSPAPSPTPAKPDQSTCKHSMVIKDAGGSMCYKCGWTP